MEFVKYSACLLHLIPRLLPEEEEATKKRTTIIPLEQLSVVGRREESSEQQLWETIATTYLTYYVGQQLPLTLLIKEMWRLHHLFLPSNKSRNARSFSVGTIFTLSNQRIRDCPNLFFMRSCWLVTTLSLVSKNAEPWTKIVRTVIVTFLWLGLMATSTPRTFPSSTFELSLIW